MTIREIQEEIIDEFNLFDDWMERYEYLIELGKSLPLINDQYKIEENIIKGCQSKVWLYSKMNDSKINFTADSDAILTKGLVALLLRVFTNQTPKDILAADTIFIDKIGLKEHLSPTRANGLVSMLKQIKLYAIAQQANTSIK
ncbi:SufE family protein [Flavobacteriaceae bacterium]|nr:SufE family protein [Flavobacteriaceae bacterium]MDB2685178.1 SufE family protein [Flavobacteriaceae bacterium]MDC0331037.1 SufE family protein [Flavobacteriaceae bacterium]MDC0636819.1 SufE family protein [Flavobacteriaceae bacterium]